MDYWRVKALRELGRDSETAPLIAELKQAIKELETPPPTVINAELQGRDPWKNENLLTLLCYF